MARYFSRFAYLYLLVALVVPALIPTGYMIGKNSTSNIVEITICSAINHRQVFLDLDTGQLLGDSDPHLQLSAVTTNSEQIAHESELDTCPFWLASAAFLTGSSTHEVNTYQPERAAVAIQPSTLVISHPTPPLPARGPPILV